MSARVFVVLTVACSSAPTVQPDAAVAVDATADADAPAVVDSCATQTVLFAFDPARTGSTLFDLTGDAEPDAVRIVEVATSQYRLDVGEPVVARIALPGDSAYLASIGATDANLDGQRDLVMGLLWERRAFVILGPLAGDLDGDDMFVSITGPTDNGLEPLFGSAVLIDDVNLDGARDIVVSAPAEREESCAGQLAPRVHLGPFAAGEQRDDADADLLLAGPMNCLGEQLTCTNGGMRASVRTTGACYTYPLTTDDPASCL